MLRLFFYLSILVAIVITVMTCKNNVADNKLDSDFISAKRFFDQTNKNWIEYLKKGDSVSFANTYTRDAKLLSSGKTIMGRDSIIHFFSNLYHWGIMGLKDTSVGLWGCKDMYVQEYIVSFYDSSGKFAEGGKEMIVWKEENDKWKIFRDMYNPDSK